MMFESFFFAGFEGATGWNRHDVWIDQVAATEHDRFADEDYRRLREVGLLAAREAVRWPLVDERGRYDCASLVPFVRASVRHRIAVVWDLFHFGYPIDLDVFSASMPERFAEYCRAAARFIVRETDGPYAFTPINEPSYFAWAAGEAGLFAPHCRGRSVELKYQLARAAILGAEAILGVVSDATIVSVDAMCRVTAPADRPDLRAEATAFNYEVVFESWDMIAGLRAPELGGSPSHLGVPGVNYYWTNQWEVGAVGTPLAVDDPRRVALAEIIRDVWRRYRRPVLVTETSHVDDGRAGWITELTRAAQDVLADGVPLGGVCLYPILGMPEWHDPDTWTRMGLWDLVLEDRALNRVVHSPMLEALREAQRLGGVGGANGARSGANGSRPRTSRARPSSAWHAS